jgi:hypothetical protein
MTAANQAHEVCSQDALRMQYLPAVLDGAPVELVQRAVRRIAEHEKVRT